MEALRSSFWEGLRRGEGVGRLFIFFLCLMLSQVMNLAERIAKTTMTGRTGEQLQDSVQVEFLVRVMSLFLGIQSAACLKYPAFPL